MREPTWQTADGSIRLFLGDCLDILPTLEAGSVDAVVTDPPYAIPAYHYIGKRGEAAPQRSLGDLSIVEHWFRNICQFFPDGPAYVFCDGQSYPVFFRSCYSKYKRIRPLTWDKLTSFNGYTWRHGSELIAWCESADDPQIPTGDGDILKCPAVPVDDRLHPAEKPIALLERLIAKTEGTILDPFMGSGTTGVACIRTGRRFCGVEIDERYFTIAVKRIEAELNRTPLFDAPPAVQRQLVPKDSP